MDLFRRIPLAFFVALTLLLMLPALAGLLAPVLVQAPVVMPAAIDRALVDLGVQEDAYAFLADLGLLAPGTACASGGCQAWYCDIMMNGSCYQRNGDGSYSPTSPVGCSGNCGGGGGSCSRGSCGNGEAYNCCAQAGRGGCGPILMGVRGQDCCGGPPEAEATVAPTPTPPPCDGERIDLIKPGGSYTQDPPHAVVVGQDPGVRGFDLKLNLRGGRAEWWRMESKQVCGQGGGAYPEDCANGPWQWRCVSTLQERHNDPIVKVEVAMRLHESTLAWIKELAARYPGARQTEPLPQVFTVWEGRAMSVRQDWHYLPSDPGVHGGRIIITTAGTPISDPQELSIPFEVKVHLKDSTLWEVE